MNKTTRWMAVLVLAAGSMKAVAWAEDASQSAITQDIRMNQQNNADATAAGTGNQAPNAAAQTDLTKDQQDVRQDRQDITQDRADVAKDVAERQQLLTSQSQIQGYISSDLAEMQSDQADIRQDRTQLRSSLDAYNDAVKKYGETSPQAQAAKDSMFKQQQSLHVDMAREKTLAGAVDFQRGALGRDQTALTSLQKDVDADKLDLHKDLKDVSSDRADIKQDRADLRGKNDAFEDARKRFGDNSPQTQAARADLDRSQLGLHHDIGDLPPDQMARYGRSAVGTEQAQAFDLKKDMQDIKADKKDVRSDRKELRSADKSYEAAQKKYGADSTQAKAAQEQVFKRQTDLHHDIGDLRKDVKDIRQDRREIAMLDHNRDKNRDQQRDNVKKGDRDDELKRRDLDRDHAAPATPTPNTNPGMPAR